MRSGLRRVSRFDPSGQVRIDAYARAGDEAYALIREALTASGDICTGKGQLIIRLDPLTAPRRTRALAALCDQLNQTQACYPGTDLVLRYEVKPHPGIA
jgi:Transposase protein